MTDQVHASEIGNWPPNETTLPYPTIAAAEGVIMAAGYVRDQQRHIWVQPGTGKTAKVERTDDLQFSIKWG